MNKKILAIWIALFCVFSVISAQEETSTVPDLRGLNVPQAAARLNEAGLRLGNQVSLAWTIDLGLPQGSISAQSITANSIVPRGTSIDISVLQAPNMRLIYDDNDLTLINLTANTVSISNLVFRSTSGTTASFSANQITSSLDAYGCLQIWSIARSEPKDVEGCDSTNWRTTNNTAEHFWTQANSVQNFAVLDIGIELVNCPAAAEGTQDSPLVCEFFFAAAGAASTSTDYIYFAYTTDAFAIINRSEDRWMPTNQTRIYIYNPAIQAQGAELIIGDPALFQNPDIVADITRLAPQQCLMLTSNLPNGSNPPQSCNLIAQRDLSSDLAFWLADFEVQSAREEIWRRCPAATSGRLTLCIVPL